jgi:hypothetical protein
MSVTAPYPESQHDEGAQEDDDADDEQVEQALDDLADDAEGHGDEDEQQEGDHG